MIRNWKIWQLLLCGLFIVPNALWAQKPNDRVLSTNVQLDPIKLHVMDSEAMVSQFRATTNFENSPTSALLELDVSKFEFNDFGDAQRAAPPDVKKVQVQLNEVSDYKSNEYAKDFKIYEAREFRHEKRAIRFVVSKKFRHHDPGGHVRLVLYHENVASDILFMREHEGTLGASSLESKLHATRWTSDLLRMEWSLKRIFIDQWNGTTARLHLDANTVHWQADGLTPTSTLLLNFPRQVKLIDTQMADPLGLGRKLWQLTLSGADQTSYYVVEDELGKHHRLIVKVGNKLKHVTPSFP